MESLMSRFRTERYISGQRLTPWCSDITSDIIGRLRTGRRRTGQGHTLFIGVRYGVVLLVEIEMGSLRVALEQQIPEANWAQARFDKLNLLDERRLRAVDHVCAYQRKMARSFKKWVKPRPLHVGDLVLKVIRGLIRDPRGKFRPN
ncbi:hypothetical protein CK203_039060 [Vitis vinifera]|uniref:Uncharacterized protein n=1 Tax=Vitis vinifera TaxID=29760 RepID=A0A438IFT9_VITVI|nr:hypothetical protein CK203_039060 [Vitis vinifera]